MNAEDLTGALEPVRVAKYDIVEFAIRFCDGLLDEAFDEYVGPLTAVYTDREAAERRCAQIISAGHRHYDARLTTAVVVSRLVTEWSE